MQLEARVAELVEKEKILYGLKSELTEINCGLKEEQHFVEKYL